MKIYFQSIGVLHACNLEFTNILSQMPEITEVHIDTDQPLVSIPAKLSYTHKKLKIHQSFSPTLPISLINYEKINLLTKINTIKSFKITNLCDILHLNDFYSKTTSYLVSMLKNKKPEILTLHQKPRNSDDINLIKNINVVISPSYYFSKVLNKTYGIKTRVISHGVNTKYFNPDIISTNKARKILKLPIDSKILLWIGRPHPEKYLSTFIKAFPIIAKEKPNTHFLIKTRTIRKFKGQLKLLKEIMKKDEKLKHNITLSTKHDTHRRMPIYYRAADVFVHTSLRESFGLTLIESLACGVPVVGSDCEHTRENVGEAGLFYQPKNPEDLAEKLLVLLGDDDLRKKLGIKGVKRIRKKGFTWDNVAKKYIKLYLSLI